MENATVTAAQLVDSGKFVPPVMLRRGSPEFFTAFNSLPAFCRIQAVARPSSDSEINIEVWLPATGWNRRYLGVGNGSFGGSISYYRLGESLRSGFATSSTDTGHRGAPSQSAWAVKHPEKQTDFDYRAVHETALTAKALIRAFYDSAPTRSYFSSCSNGGRQGLMEAERYPTDYDGILAGAPATRFGFRTFLSGDFAAFQKRGGKIIIYHGGNDRPAANLDFYSTVRRRMGDSTVNNFLQLYLLPGMGHCGSGNEPNDFGQWLRPGDSPQNSLFSALQEWVEKDVRPNGVIATKFAIDGDPRSAVVKRRRICPYPRTARSNRLGSDSDSANYVCP
ncbi:MAG: tannase/feruloyl esterase family alpha/beta hydrolase [Gemmatimonadota bacterium]|nr:tannase/feruloyl esterase family alpha/beta hydrolase [Gemmatimonadota bacterium]